MVIPELTKIHCIVAKDTETNQVYSFKPNEVEKGLDLLADAKEIIVYQWYRF